MKFILTLLLFPFISNAYPAIGDSATYNSVLMYNTSDGFNYTTVKKILEFRINENKYLISKQTSLDNDVKKIWVPSNNLYSRYEVLEILKNCKKHNGKPTIIVVPAGQFNTCVLNGTDQDNYLRIWIADVPFGYVKLRTVELENTLESFE